jgi:hypothetical protein
MSQVRMSQAQTLTDAELDAVSGGDAVAAVGIASLSAAGSPGVTVSASIAASTTGGSSSATVVLGVTLTQTVASE